MKKYNSYKDSGIEWIGEIPSHWEVKKVNYCFEQIGSGTTPTAGQPEYYENGNFNWLQTGDLNDSEIFETSKKITQEALNEYSTLKFYPENSLVIAMYGATIGKTGLLKIESTTNQACCVLSKPKKLNYKFSFYWLNYVKPHVISLSYGGGQPNINQEQIRSLKIQCPPLSEQTAIAAYLDRKTAEIDALIADKKRLLALYEEEKTAIINQAVTKGINPDVPMKDSGIEWLGEIPAHWEVKRLKMIVSKIGSGITPSGGASVYLTSGIPLLRSQNIHFDGLKLDDVAFISEEIDESMSNSRIQDGDVLLNITGASIGRCFFVPVGFGRGNVNQHVCIIRPIIKKIDTLYLNMLMRSEIGQIQIKLQQTGANREGLNFEQLKNFILPIPHVNEQQSIVRHIETECARIDAHIARTTALIELLTEYRTALISEVVTGKINVIE